MPPRRHRPGFSLIELLVVLSILAVLATLSASAAFKIIGVQQTSQTRTALVKLQSQLDVQWAAVTQRARDEEIPDAVRNHPDFVAMAGTDAHTNARARVVYVKLKQRQMFPMTFDEALNPSPLPPLKPYVVFLQGLGIRRSTSPMAPYESAICLLMALERSPGGGGVNAEDLGTSTVTASLAALPGGQQVHYLADAWKSPLIFCRWPTGCALLNPRGAGPGRNDPGDPQGLLNVHAWLVTPGASAFRRYCHDLPPRPASAGPSSYRLAPVLASAGPDRRADLDPRTLQETGPGARDTLYSSAR